MSNPVVKNIIRFILLVLFQVLVLNNIQINGYINPYYYVLFILILPFETPKWLILISGFFLGLTIDFFSHTIGMHAAATTLMAFLRPATIRLLSANRDLDPGNEPSIRDMGFSWFFMYTLILVFFHHVLLFYLEVFRFDEFFQTLGRVVISTVVSVLLIIIGEYIVRKRKK
jgi:rod shape-determining protein MreD